MSAATITYYCAKSATDIARLALEYRKIQEIAKLRTELERQNLFLSQYYRTQG